MPNTDERAERERGWTAQQGSSLPEEALTANQMFTPEQLPDPDIARAAGIAPQQIPTRLVLDGDEAYAHPLGPEPGERERLEHREAIKQTLEEAGAGPQPRGRTFPDGTDVDTRGPDEDAVALQQNIEAGSGAGTPEDTAKNEGQNADNA